jgi:hypothetical protein
LFALTAASVLGEPLEELHSLAQLSSIDLAALKRGQVIVERRPNGDFPRGVSLESCYFLQVPLTVVGEALLHWDPVSHKQLEIHHYGEFSMPPAPDALKALRLSPGAPDDNWLLTRTAEVGRGSAPTELHLTTQETELLRQKSADPSAAWQQILRERAEALARGGLSAVAPYGVDNSISPASEFRGLLTLAPKAAQHFRQITKARPISPGGTPASEAVGYWEMAKVRDHTTLQLGVFAAQKEATSWQLINCMYYPSDTYFMAVDLFQLWPVDGGTLVWQVGFVSAPFRSYLGGVDRYVAGKQMIQETIDTIKAFRADVEKRR